MKSITDKAILLVGIPDERGILRFANDASSLPGLLIENQYGLGIHEQLVAGLSQFMGGMKFSPPSFFGQHYELVETAEYGRVAIFPALLKGHFSEETLRSWPTLPDLLRAMPKDRIRVAYVKLWQVICGALDQETKAIEFDDLN